MVVVLAAALIAAVVLAARVRAQAPAAGAAELDELVRTLRVPVRALMVAAHPDDEDTQLLTWLARARGATTSYLSLTRGDGGQNLIGNELGEALGAIRTEELLAARRVDGARQFFTRAFDFGFSKTAEETYRHWPHDTILGDVVRVLRTVRPHVVIAVFSGTPRDGHGHHQVSGLLAREAWDAADDTVRFPTAAFGPSWRPAKFYRAARFRAAEATLAFDVGGYDPLRGRGYAELAGESRSQHRSQGFGVLQRKGALPDYLIREATRLEPSGLPGAGDAKAERDVFDGLDTLAITPPPGVNADSARRVLARLRQELDLRAPWPAVASAMAVGQWPGAAPLVAQAAGIALEATAPSPTLAVGDSAVVTLTLFNRGSSAVTWLAADTAAGAAGTGSAGTAGAAVVVPPGGSATRLHRVVPRAISEPWWRAEGRVGDWWRAPIAAPGAPVPDEASRAGLTATATVDYGTAGAWPVTAALVHRYADPVQGDRQRGVLAVPRVAVRLERRTGYLRAGVPVRRVLRVLVRSAAPDTQEVRLSLELPAGLEGRPASPTVRVPPGVEVAAEFVVTGRVAAGRHRLAAVATTRGADGNPVAWRTGVERVDYDHIRPLLLSHPAEMELTALDVALPAATAIGYVPGVGDNVRPLLEDLGFAVTTLDSTALDPAVSGESARPSASDRPMAGRAGLARFGAIVVGPRAFEAHAGVFARRAALFDYARAGGTLVLQYGQYELTRPGALPLPLTIARPHDRVTEEDAPVRVLRPDHPVLRAPNRITETDWDGWVQERALYMARTFDPAFAAPVSMHDPGEPPREGGLLVAPLGRGTLVYTALAFFRQLPAGVPGAARLFVNLLAARPAP